MNNYQLVEKKMKSSLKEKVRITLSTVVSFLITGTIAFGANYYDYSNYGVQENFKYVDDLDISKGCVVEIKGGEYKGNFLAIGSWEEGDKIGSVTTNIDGNFKMNSEKSILLTGGFLGISKENTPFVDTINLNIGLKSDKDNAPDLFNVYGGSLGYSKTNNINIKVANGNIDLIHGSRSGEVKNTNIEISGGNISRITAGGLGSSYMGEGEVPKGGIVEKTKIKITGGSIKDLYIGGRVKQENDNNDEVYETTSDKGSLVVSGGKIENVYGGGLVVATNPKNYFSNLHKSEIEISGGEIKNLYAGGNGFGAMTTQSIINLIGGKVENIFGNGLNGGKVESSVLNIGGLNNLYYGEISSLISNFNEVNVNSGSQVVFNNFNLKNSGEKINLGILSELKFNNGISLENQILNTKGNTEAEKVELKGENSKVVVSSGVLKTNDFEILDGGKVELLGKGTIKVSSKEIFENGYEEGIEDAGEIKSEFLLNGGTLEITDEKLSTKYIISVLSKLGEKVKLAISGDVIDFELGADGSVLAKDLQGIGVDNKDVTVKSGKDIVIGHKEEGAEDDVEVGSLEVKKIELLGSDEIHINSGSSLTLLGNGEEDLVKSENEVSIDVTGSSLSLGSDKKSNVEAGHIHGKVILEEDSVMYVTNGNYKVQKENPEEIDIVVNKSTVGISKLGSLETENMKSDKGGELDVAGKLKVKNMDLKKQEDQKGIIRVAANTGEIQADNFLVDGGGEIYVDGKVNVNELMKLSVKDSSKGLLKLGENGVLEVGKMDVTNGKLDMEGTLKVQEMKLNEETVFNVNGDSRIGQLIANAKNKINVGDSEHAGRLEIGGTSLNGATLFLDPAWKDAVGIAGASSASIDYFIHGSIDGDLGVGQNSILVLGSASADWALNGFRDSSLLWGGGTGQVGSALAIASPQILGERNFIVVDRTVTFPPQGTENKIEFREGTLLIVDVEGIGNNPAISFAGNLHGSSLNPSVQTASGTKLLLVNPKVGKDIYLFKNFTNYGFLSWNSGNIYSSDRMIDVSRAKINTLGIIPGRLIRISGSEILPGLKMVNSVDKIWDQGLNNLNSDNPGIEFLTKGLDINYVADDNMALKVLNSAALISELGGHQKGSLDVRNSINSSIITHKCSEMNDNIWVDYTNGKIDFDNGEVENKNELNGAIIGKDYIIKDGSKLGMALSFGRGKITSKGNFEKTENEYKYYGLDLYYNNEFGNYSLIADLGVMRNFGDITQDNFFGKIGADLDTRVFSLGISGESKEKYMGLTPYVGLNMISLITSGFNTENSKGVMFETEKSIQNLLLMPVGVKYSKNYYTKFGTITPSVKLEMVSAFIEKQMKNVVKVKDVDAKDRIKSQMLDSLMFVGKIGIELEKNNISYGLRYEFNHSEKINTNNVGMKIEYIF